MTKEGFILPKKVDIVGQLIRSEYLERSMRVVNKDLQECGIGPLLNEYQVSKYDSY